MLITIKEGVAKKCPGITSFTLEFEYNANIVELVKQLDGACYDKKTRTWEIPVLVLSKLLDSVAELADVSLHLKKDKVVSKKQYRLKKYKTTPFKHQIEAIQYGLTNEKFLLTDAPGLGKTATVIHLAEELKSREGIKHCLVVCGINALKSNWAKEITKHSNLDSVIIGRKVTKTGNITTTSVAERIKQLKKKIPEFFVIINIESLRNDEVIKVLLDGPNKYDMIVADEVHKFKNCQAAQTKNFLKLNKATHRIGLTGTLLLNSPLDAYVPLKWLGYEHSSYTTFRYFYCVYDNMFHNILMGYKNTDLLKQQLQTCSLRRTKDLLELPPKTVIKEYVEMDDTQADFYEQVKNGIRDQVDKVRLTTANVLALTARLRQATVCPSILSTENIPSAKLDRCCQLVEDIVSNGDKVVIFSTFKEPLYVLHERLKQYNPVLGTGDLKDSDVSHNIDLFQTDDKYKVFLGTHSKIGTGVTLTAASYGIFLDELWVPADNLQSEDRLHRIGTHDKVFIYYLITKDTIDEHVDEVANDKSIVTDYIIDGSVPEKAVNKLRELILDI